MLDQTTNFRSSVAPESEESYPIKQEAEAGQEWLRDNLGCQRGCPAHTDVSTFVELIARQRFDEAYLINRRDNIFPGVLGRICPHPCEKECRRSWLDQPVAICSLKRASADFREDKPLPNRPAVTRSQKVAIVGAGPAGLSCARDLRERGYATTVYDAMSKPGGMLVAGIPAWRLPREVIHQEVDQYFEALGVEFRLNTRIGKDVKLEELLREYEAVFLAPGCQKSQNLTIPGQHWQGFEYGLPWLEKVNLGEVPDLKGKRVAVIGAGFSAMDCCRSALRFGASEVYLCYRRTQREAPLDEAEIERGEKEGVRFIYLVSPVEIQGEEVGGQGQVKALKLIRNQLGAPDEKGRRTPQPIAGSEFKLECEVVLAATGQAGDFSWLPAGLKREIVQHGHLKVDPVSWQTTTPGLFAGGDFTEGPRNVISAIADGHKVAQAIHRYLSGEPALRSVRHFVPLDYPPRRLNYLKTTRQSLSCLPVGECLPPSGSSKANLQNYLEKELEQGYDLPQALAQAERCLRCRYNVTIVQELCIGCGVCLEVCPPKVLKWVKVSTLAASEYHLYVGQAKIPQTGEVLVLDENGCVRCGQCVAECPTAAIQMGQFSYSNSAGHWFIGTGAGF